MSRIFIASAASALMLLASSLGAAAQDADSAQLELGKQVFLETAEPQCAICHTLADAGSDAEIGPILDQLKPDAERTANAVRNGVGVMPAYGDTLSDEEIDAVAAYVAQASGAN